VEKRGEDEGGACLMEIFGEVSSGEDDGLTIFPGEKCSEGVRLR